MDFVPADKRDACQSLKAGSCPVPEDEILIHEVSLPVDAPFDDVTISMEAYMIDDSNKPIFCYRTTVTVKAKEGAVPSTLPSTFAPNV